LLKQGGTVVEGTSGSTGISLSLMCRARGYKCIIVMPDDQAREKTDLLKCYGAELKLVRPCAIANKGHYCNVAEQVAKDTPGAFFANQFENVSNFNAHYYATGPEIWDQTNGSHITKPRKECVEFLFVCSR
jgi:cysteine synthase A